jgi:hypothetical protein
MSCIIIGRLLYRLDDFADALSRELLGLKLGQRAGNVSEFQIEQERDYSARLERFGECASLEENPRRGDVLRRNADDPEV